MSDYQGNGIWCIAELRHGNLIPTIFELLTPGRKMADSSKQPLCAVVIGAPGKASEAAQQIAARGAEKVYVLENAAFEQFVDEGYAAALKSLIEKEKPAKVLLPASAMGRSLSARLAVLCKASFVSDATEVGLDGQGHLLATHPCYGGNLLSYVASRRGLETVTIRPMAYPRAEQSSTKGAVVNVPVDTSSWKLRTKFVSYSPEESKEIDLSTAEKIVSGGRGLGNAQGFEIIRELARMLGAAVGASRAVVDAGWIPYRHQVGLTGRTVRPKLYVACGISGQIQHLAGMSSSDLIIAINSDPDCPMMKLANFSVEGDVYQIIPAIITEIKRQRGEAVPAAATSH